MIENFGKQSNRCFPTKIQWRKIVFSTDDTILSDDKVIAESFNSHFVTITDSLGLDPTFQEVGIHKTPEKMIDTAVKKYKDRRSIAAIKRKVKVDHEFEFRFVTLLHVTTKIEALKTNKPSSNNLPTKIIQEAKR